MGATRPSSSKLHHIIRCNSVVTLTLTLSQYDFQLQTQTNEATLCKQTHKKVFLWSKAFRAFLQMVTQGFRLSSTDLKVPLTNGEGRSANLKKISNEDNSHIVVDMTSSSRCLHLSLANSIILY